MKKLSALFYLACFVLGAQSLLAQKTPCQDLPDFGQVKAALVAAVKEGNQGNGGSGNQEWAAVVDRDGIVCGRVQWAGPDCRMARQPHDRCREGEHCQCIERP